MSVVDADQTASERATAEEPETPDRTSGEPSRFRSMRADLLILAGFVAVGIYLFSHVWLGPGSRILAHSYNDHYQFEWFLAVDTYNITHFHNPFFTDLQNASIGVNLMGNASVLGLALPLLPITLLFGPSASFLTAVTLGFALTAFGWYWVLHRDLRLHRAAAVLGGAFAAFAPTIISHGNAHLNLVSMFLVPWIVRYALRLFRTARPVRDGLILGLMIAYQALIGEEILLMTAIALGVFVIVYAFPLLPDLRAMVRPFLTGLGVAVAVSLPLLAYPLWMQFAGPRHYDSLGGLAYVTNDLNTFFEFSTTSVGNLSGTLTSTNYAEENGYFGWALLILAAGLTLWLWRDRLVRTVAILGAVGLAFSLGPNVNWHFKSTGLPGPWKLFVKFPVLDSMNVGRFTFLTVVALAVILAVATDRILKAAADAGVKGSGVPLRLVWVAALAAALVPLLPLPLPATGRPPVPKFFTSGAYKQYVAENHTVVPVPALRATGDMTALTWQMAADMNFRMPEGYFMGPIGPDNVATNEPPPGPVTSVLLDVTHSGKAVTLTPAQQAEMLAQLRTWKADAIVVYRTEALPQLRETLDPLLGTGRQVEDVWLWDVRSLTRG
ncbi:glycosyl transferase [Dactylosporangium sp. NPDC049140]|uniref:glycosyl transferase n=1 Tax=Dactylosporangium sp. NPDC049140 TaxID=3155647 RepID=UPI0033D151E9